MRILNQWCVLAVAVALLPGCAAVYQPRAVVESSMAVELLLAGPLEGQPATTQAAQTKWQKSRLVELEERHTPLTDKFPLLTEKDILDYKTFCGALKAQATAPVKTVWGALTDDGKKAVGDIVGSEKPDTDKKKLVEALNEVLGKPDFTLYDTAMLDQIEGTDELRAFVAARESVGFSEGSHQRLNRLVLEACFPKTIAKGFTHKAKFAEKVAFWCFPILTSGTPVFMLPPPLVGKAIEVEIDGQKVQRRPENVGLQYAFEQLAKGERLARVERETLLRHAVAEATQTVVAAQQELLAKYGTAGAATPFDRLPLLVDLEGKRREPHAVAGARLARIHAISLQKQRLYENLAKQALALSVSQRALTDHHLNMEDSVSIDGLRYRYELYRGAYERMRERIEKAFDEGKKEAREDREKVSKTAQGFYTALRSLRD